MPPKRDEHETTLYSAADRRQPRIAVHRPAGRRRRGAGVLAGAAQRNYSNVHGDVAALEELGLVERTAEGAIHVPFETVEIHVALADAA